MSTSNNIPYEFRKNYYYTMNSSLMTLHRTIIMLFNAIFNDDPAPTIDDVSLQTGIDANHLRAVFLGSEAMTLMDYIILSDYTGCYPLNDKK